MHRCMIMSAAACAIATSAAAAPSVMPHSGSFGGQATNAMTVPLQLHEGASAARVYKIARRKKSRSRRRRTTVWQDTHANLSGSPWANLKSNPYKFGQSNKPFSFNSQQADPAKPGSKKGAAKLSGGSKPYIPPQAPKTVAFRSGYGAGTVVIDTKGRKLYYVLSSTAAYQYPIAVGRAGFSWTGTKTITRKTNWPDWRPPAEMRKRKPSLPKLMKGGINNPLGAKALYLGNSLYRIHGTNNVKSIGTASSSGCFRMTNGHVTHLAGLVKIGTKVRVLRKLPKRVLAGSAPSKYDS